MTPPPDAAALRPKLTAIRKAVGDVFLGKPDVVELALTGLLADGHLLLEDVPGVGKTLLAKTLAACLGCSFRRVQFTPDLLPGDLTGSSVLKNGAFEFLPGPVFAQVLLADEINRATPRTQSALLEAMAERQVTTDGVTRPLGPPFLVLATQNPYEFEGTFPLPESQLDRFLLRLSVGYPAREAERDILLQHRTGEPTATAVLSPADVMGLQALTREVRVEPVLADYLLDLIHATRDHPDVRLGASTRAALGLYRATQAAAVLAGRDFATPDDAQRVAGPVLAHRLLTKAWEQGGRNDAGPLVGEILTRTRVRT